MSKSIEIHKLVHEYGDEVTEQIIHGWQNDISVHPMTCNEHSGASLRYDSDHQALICPEPSCYFHQHWIPSAVVKRWLAEFLDWMTKEEE